MISVVCIKCGHDLPDGSLYCNICGKKQATQQRRKAKRPNNDGGAWKRGSTWTAIWTTEKSDLTDDNRIIRHRSTKGGFKTRKAAEDYAKQMSDLKVRPREAPTLKEYWEHYEKNGLQKLSKKKALGYKKAWERLAPLHGKRVNALFTPDIQKVIDDQNLTYWNVKDIKNLLQHLFDFAAGEGWASRELPDLITLPDANPTERVPFTVEETKKIWDAYCNGNRDAGMALIMIYTGMMPGELQLLTVADVDFENGLVSAGVGLKTKVRKKNSAVLNKEALALLRERCEGLQPEDYIFYKRAKTFYKRYYAALEAIPGVRQLEPYSCRHTTATVLAVKKLLPEEAIQRVMRWSSPAMLRVYAHADLDDARRAVEELNVDHRVDHENGFQAVTVIERE